MPIDDATLEHLAHLTRIDLDAIEDVPKETLKKRVNAHWQWIDNSLQDGDDSLPPLVYVGDPQTALRDDVPQKTLGTDTVLRNAPARDQDFFLVPQVVDDNS